MTNTPDRLETIQQELRDPTMAWADRNALLRWAVDEIERLRQELDLMRQVADANADEALKARDERDALRGRIDAKDTEIAELKWRISHPVVCQGLCASQTDDYCGMHMSNESCIACNAVWTEAHAENAQRTADAERDATIARQAAVLDKCLEYIEPQVEHYGYGFFPGGDPTTFTPDSDNRPEEIENWKEACRRWNEGNKEGEPSSHVPFDLGEGIVGHATVAKLGMGSYIDVDEDAAEIVKTIQSLKEQP